MTHKRNSIYRRKRVLVDIDGVLADFDRAVLENFKRKHPKLNPVQLEDRRTFYVKDNYPEHYLQFLEEIYLAKGFYANLPPIPGAIAGITSLAKDHDLYLCTSPLLQNPYCIPEKLEWIPKHLGSGWLQRTIITRDKTLIRAEFLVDDKPEISGKDIPTWQHILYDQPYNRAVQKPRITWDNTEELELLLEQGSTEN